MSDFDIDPDRYCGSATAGVPGATECPACGETLRSTSTPDPEEVTSVIERECLECDYETKIAIVWFPETRYVVITDPLAEVGCEKDGCGDAARLVSILSSTQVIRRHCLSHVREYLKTVSADARLL